MTSISKRSFIAMGLGAVVLAGAGYTVIAGSGSSTSGVEQSFMTVDQMKANGGLIVDIRTPPEWRETGVIDGAALLTFNDPKSFLAQVGPALADGRDLILICHSGNRSSRAAAALDGLIANHIISVNGGMSQQIAAGYQTVPPT